MTNTPKPQLPIGYWLKRVDALLTTAIDQAQAEHGVSRTQWQVLNIGAPLLLLGIFAWFFNWRRKRRYAR